MKKLLFLTFTVSLLVAGLARADDIRIGILLGYTGPIESLTPAMAEGAELAIEEVNATGMLLGGHQVTAVRADSTCADSAAATAAAERLVTADQVNAIMGADCSGVTGSVLQNVARANGIVMISPSATSPGLSTAEDDGLFFRTAPSDARQGVVMTDIIRARGIASVALTYTNNDYGKGLADSFQAAFEAAGGTVTISVPHEDGKADYSAEVGTLAAAGGEVLVVVGYVDQGGKGIIRSALDSGAFDRFVLPDGMIGDSLTASFGSEIDGSFGQAPGTDSPGMMMFSDLAGDSDISTGGPFVAESYDAAALIMLAMQASGSASSQDFKDHVMDVANEPGEVIFPGELGKALAILADGGAVNYVGASAVELIGPGESAGNYREIEIRQGVIETARYR